MSVTRACLPCRGAKTKCDLVRPICGRCAQRGLNCTGYPLDTSLIFRNENETARRNSERARRDERGNPTFPVVPDPFPTPTQQDEMQSSIANPSQLQQLRTWLGDHGLPTRTSAALPNLPPEQLHPWLTDQTLQAQTSTAASESLIQQLYPWLNEHALAEIPRHIREDIETRAVDRFFINWTLNPRNDGISPGHMHYLPMLYSNAAPGSILWLIVRAMAFAEMRNESTGDNSFPTKALEHYGAALTQLRSVTDDAQTLCDDHVLAAILLIDSFESMHFGRTEPLGPHSDAVKHALYSRGDRQFLNSSSFSLWLLAFQRLQAREMLLHEEPNPEELRWLSKLNMNSEPFHILADIEQMIALAAAANRMTQINGTIQEPVGNRIESARNLTQTIEGFIASLEDWTMTMADLWRPKVIDPLEEPQIWKMDEESDLPIPDFLCPRVLNYDDVWLAYIWNSHVASQIILRESLVDVVIYLTLLQGNDLGLEEMGRIQAGQGAVHQLSSMLIRSFPQLLGFIHKDTQQPYFPEQGKMAGRFFALFSMRVVQQARFTTTEHKQTASEVMHWINSSYGLL